MDHHGVCATPRDDLQLYMQEKSHQTAVIRSEYAEKQERVLTFVSCQVSKSNPAC